MYMCVRKQCSKRIKNTGSEKMIKIAIVEDEKIQADNFIKNLNRFAIENDL